MERYPMPYNMETSKELLSKFMENATNIRLQDRISTAVEIVFGRSFEVRVDLSRRMCFFCVVCTKEMNNVKALQEHSSSGNHIKNEDSKRLEAGPSFKYEPRPSKMYPPDTLQGKIQSSRTDVIGLQCIEGYTVGRRSYFKCNLCGAHGKADPIYNHVIGNSHTDKYIKLRIALKNPVIDSDVRQRVRRIIHEKERFNADDIIVIKGDEYYPYKWEQESQRSRSKSKRKTEFIFDIEDIENKVQIKKELSIKETKDRNLQCFSYNYFNQILLKCNVIVKAHLDECTDLHSPEDVKMALNLLFYILHLLHYTVKGSCHDADGEVYDSLDKQAKIIKTCLGYLYKRIIPRYVRKNGTISY